MQEYPEKMKCDQVFYDFGYCLLETERIQKKKSSMNLNYFPLKGVVNGETR